MVVYRMRGKVQNATDLFRRIAFGGLSQTISLAGAELLEHS
jgi:hypothetical protein